MEDDELEDKENTVMEESMEEKEIVDDSTDEDVSNQAGQFDFSKLDIYLRDFDLHLINFLTFKLDMNLSSKTIPDSAKRYQEISNDDTDSEIKIAPHLMWFVLSEMNQKVKSYASLLILIKLKQV